MKLRCKPNQRCLIVGEVRGCEANLGATVTVVRVIPPPSETRPAWVFKDASRPILALDIDKHGNPVPGSQVYVTGTYGAGCDERPLIFDHHLMPLEGNHPAIDEDTGADVSNGEAINLRELAIDGHSGRRDEERAA